MSPTHPSVLASPELWSAHVAGHADLADERLNTRLGLVLSALAHKPLDSFPQACGRHSQAKALYRFLANPRLDAEALLQPLVDTTTDFCRGLKTLLVIQDSSSLNYSSLEHTEGLGPINNSPARGLHMHSTLAARTDGVLLGLLHQSYWSRPATPPAAPPSRQRPFPEKESFKWLEGVEAAEAAVAALPVVERPRLIHLMDREGDVHEVLEHIAASPHGCIIRCVRNRKVDGPIDQAHQAVAASALIGTTRLEVPAQAGHKKRSAQLELRAHSCTIQPNTRKYPNRLPFPCTLVEAREINPPADAEPLHWLLWTTEPAQTFAELLEILRWYKLRWRIEDFHLVLKSGCQAEKLALETADRLIKALMLYSAVAIRIVAMRDLARQEPDAPCTLLLSDDAWRALWAHCNGRRPPADTPPPTIRQAVLWIGRLGGHLGRKRDGLPGVRVLWRGWRDLTLLVAGYRAAHR